MKSTMKRLLPFLTFALLFTVLGLKLADIAHERSVHAQNRTRFTGIRNAITYDYGTPASAAPPLQVSIGIAAPGTTSVTLLYGYTVLSDGTQITPLATNAPILIGAGSNQETVRPTAVSCSTPAVINTCTITGWFHNAHGTGDPVGSATFGLMEAVNDAHTLGGLVAVDGTWASAGGVTATITGGTPAGTGLGFTNVTVLDWRGTTTAKSYTSTSNNLLMTATSVNLY